MVYFYYKICLNRVRECVGEDDRAVLKVLKEFFIAVKLSPKGPPW
jgi:hypothetical protein